MSTRLYMIPNSTTVSSGLTAAPAKVTTANVIKTMMQVQCSSTAGLEVVEWGISFDGSAAATPGVCELVDTVAVASTGTIYNAADIVKMSTAQAGQTSTIVLGTTASSFTATIEGSTTVARLFDVQLLPPTAPYIKQFPLERGPTVLPSENLRIRVTFGTAINALCYVVWAE